MPNQLALASFIDARKYTYDVPNVTEFGTHLGTVPCPYKHIYCAFDVSGSTDNVGSSGRGGVRGGSRFDYEDQTIDSTDLTPKTKIIVMAELEGLANVLAILCAKYDLTGIMFSLKSFGSNVFNCLSTELKSNADLLEIITDLPKHILCDFSSTATLPCLQEFFDSENLESKLLILATDGQPNVPSHSGTAPYVLEYVKELRKKDRILNIITIGAGSIQEACGATALSFYRGLTVVAQRQAHGSSECNLPFLVDLKNLSSLCGVYLPACRDYTELKKGMSDFVANTKVMTFGVFVDGVVSKCEHPDRIVECISNGFCYFSKRPYGDFFVVRDETCSIYQIRLKTESKVTLNDSGVTDVMKTLTETQVNLLEGIDYPVGYTSNELFRHFMEQDLYNKSIDIFDTANRGELCVITRNPATGSYNVDTYEMDGDYCNRPRYRAVIEY